MSQDHSPSTDETHYVNEDTPDGVTLGGVHSAVCGLVVQVNGLSERFGPMHAEMAQVKVDMASMLGILSDLAPRVTSVEKTAKAKAKVITIWGLSLTGIVGLAAQAASIFYPKLQGPLQTLLQLLNGAQ